jgi:hypothetical protein
MSDRLKKLENKKLIQEYMYTKSDIEYKKIIIEQSQSKFFDAVYDILGDDRKPSNEVNEECNEKRNSFQKKSWNEFSKAVKDKAKILYRAISKKTHPDKDIYGIYSGIFKESATAYEECKLLDLYEICDRLKISFEIKDEEMEIIKNEIEKNKEDSKLLESSFVYLWSIHHDDKMKDMLINQFIRINKGKI